MNRVIMEVLAGRFKGGRTGDGENGRKGEREIMALVKWEDRRIIRTVSRIF
jgi:hypothetical protein